MHLAPMPTWGGLAMVVGFGITMAALLWRGGASGVPPAQIGAVVGGGFIIALVGAIDDRFDMRAAPKFLAQVICAALLIPFGVSISGLAGHPIPPWLGSVLTVAWVVSIVNAVNFVDGLDGLAAGVVGIASLALAVVAAARGQLGAAALSAALAGSAAGFLPYNFNPARIFMGDLGSHFLGYTAAATAVLGTFKIAASVALLAPVVAFAVPIFDTLWAMIRRYRNGQSIARADRNHLHHRLLDRGLSQRQAVLIIYAISAVCSAVAIVMSLPT
ncbi:MAG: undecaprenyl/decaprenyl-phosphate alpha-N-acetylglucosaminyl 1-phosphate transferase [Armatimonadota bacterium]|nr:MAG: undecaprenyl/decaprenyl-phosphate alpha-N-acetylglucosaminyl 1-phosphate transferase [Armatimonadota bacterium]